MFTRRGNSRANPGQGESHETDAANGAHPNPDEASHAHAGDAQYAGTNPGKFPPPSIPDTTVIGKNFALEGDNIVMRCKGALSINGNVHADIHCEQLTIADHARITGSIAADEVAVHGRVEGVINGSQVTLHGTADVEGDINSQFLSIDRGARFDGRSRRVSDPSEVAPQLMSGANDSDGPEPQSTAYDNSVYQQTSLEPGAPQPEDANGANGYANGLPPTGTTNS